MAKKVHFISLGCPKNTVDSERMVGLAQRQGLAVVARADDAEIIVVNTCGFIEAAKRESINALLEVAEHKQHRCKTLVMAGCLSQRYGKELAAELPEVDHFLGTTGLGQLEEIFSQEREAERYAVEAPTGMEEARYERALIGPAHTAYLKISEGCNRPCAFCSIPLMRGQQRSRAIASLVEEARGLVERGARELILVAQDSTAYGSDLARGEADLPRLLHALAAIEGLRWLRIHYAYPSMIYPPLIEAMAELPQVVPYLDLPLQHIDDEVLKRMRRGYGGDRVRRVLDELRAAIPDIWVRTTLLVGHPGENDRAHQQLVHFVQSGAIDHLGAFVFSPEDDTPAATMEDVVPPELAAQRRDELMALQQTVSAKRLASLHGRTIEVMVDGISDESEFLLKARHAGQSPGIDGLVHLADANAQPGELVQATVTDSDTYDLIAHQHED